MRYLEPVSKLLDSVKSHAKVINPSLFLCVPLKTNTVYYYDHYYHGLPPPPRWCTAQFRALNNKEEVKAALEGEKAANPRTIPYCLNLVNCNAIRNQPYVSLSFMAGSNRVTSELVELRPPKVSGSK